MAINNAVSRSKIQDARDAFLASCILQLATESRGFALLVAVIFMSVMLTLGLELGSLAYKQEVLASGSVQSQYAFYVADAALECALYADQQQNLFAYPATAPASAPQMSCGGAAPFSSSFSYTASQFAVFTRLSLDSGKRCADVSVYKPATFGAITYAYAQGYDAPCATVANPGTARFVARGLNAYYNNSSAASANNAMFVSQTVPATMVAGQTYSVSVTMQNIGLATWTAAGAYKLGSQNPQDNGIWGVGRVLLSNSVPSGASYTFTFNVTAPSSPGTYNFQWGMLQEGVMWFGQFSTNIPVVVN